MESVSASVQFWSIIIGEIGIIGSLVFNAYTAWKEDKSLRVSNRIEINKEHREIWKALYTHPELERITARNVDLIRFPVTFQEELMVNFLILHLDATYEAIRAGVYVKIEQLNKDVRFFLLPIPNVSLMTIISLAAANLAILAFALNGSIAGASAI